MFTSTYDYVEKLDQGSGGTNRSFTLLTAEPAESIESKPFTDVGTDELGYEPQKDRGFFRRLNLTIPISIAIWCVIVFALRHSF